MSPSVLQDHHALLTGSGATTMAFAHGFGCDHQIWRKVQPALARRCRTLVYDHAGCGQSVAAWSAQRHASLQGYADDLLAVLDAARLDRVLGVGHSVGSVIMLHAALAQPQRFSRLVMLAPSPRFLNDPPDYVGGFEPHDIDELLALMEANHFGWAHFLAPLAIGQGNPMALTREFEQALCSLEPRIARHFARLSFLVDVRQLLPQLQVPVTVVQCADDALAPVAVGRWMHRHLAGSDLVELPISGHCPHVSHPDEVVKILDGLLDA